ncbi:MAG TPA: DotU family type IV/VI secretion system protein [Pyrinomonadaceae bacterium]|nr:DotU family type IV/VI secretion system protein [Pyrinomonadaceae bacterium]
MQQNESFLLAQFRDFYTEVIRLKQLIETSGGMCAAEVAPADPIVENGDKNTAQLPPLDAALLNTLSGRQQITSLAVRGSLDTMSEPGAEHTSLTLLVWQNMITLFRRNGIQILRAAGKPTDNYLDAQYVMAAFADDIFVHLNWEGRTAWTSNLLETALFQSHVSGEKFFDKLDRLLRHRDPANRSLAAVYLSALSLGFRGKYYGLNDHGKLRRYRRDLYDFIFNKPADLLNESKIAFPDSYVQNVRKEKRKKLTNPRVWLAVLGMVLVTYLAASHVIWWRLTSPLEKVNDDIVDVERRLESLPPPGN